jgi:hypothetical protein
MLFCSPESVARYGPCTSQRRRGRLRPDRKLAPHRVAADGVDHHDPGGSVGVSLREEPRQQPG